MKQLKRVVLNQYFLYEATDIDVSGNTAFLGPNGAGKTALLDALQIVLLGADGHRLFFNASGETTRRARGLRDYCLGLVNTTRIREHANTYIDLIFQDAVTGEEVTAGVALTADAGSERHEIQALYIAPGVPLWSADHIEQREGTSATLPWREFRHVLEARCQQAGSKLWIAPNGEQFVRHLLVEHLASPGDRPNPGTFRNVLPRALRLGTVIDNLGDMLRTQLFEARPVDVQGFRQQVAQFREMRDVIRQLKSRLEQASVVVTAYEQVKRSRTREHNLDALAAVLQSEAAGEALGAAQDECNAEEDTHRRLQGQLATLETKTATAKAAFEEALKARQDDPDYQKQAGHAERLNDLKATVKRERSAIARQLADVRVGLDLFIEAAAPADTQAIARSAVDLLATVERDLECSTPEPPPALRELAAAISRLCVVAQQARTTAEANERSAEHEFQDARTAAERVSQGLPKLHPTTIALQRLLAAKGIRATPVCDLVTVTDRDWQPAIEAYLGRHVEALLVSREDQLHAIDLYRGLRGEARVYGVKLALTSRIRPWRLPGPGQYAAQMIGGDPVAADYLRGELGRIRLARSSAELQGGDKSISQDGMVVKGGGAERIRVTELDALRIGRHDQSEAESRARSQLQHVADQLAAAQQTAQTAQAIASALAAFADGTRWVRDVESAWGEAQSASATASRIERDLLSAAGPQLQQLEADVTAAREHLDALQIRQTALQSEAGRNEGRLSGLRRRVTELQAAMELAAAQERERRQTPWYDAAEVDRLRVDFEAKHEEGSTLIAAIHNAAQAAQSRAVTAERDGWQHFCDYNRAYDCRNHDIVSDQWRRAYDFVVEERNRIADTEIAQYEKESDTVYKKAAEAFRHGVARALLEGFAALREQVNDLNRVLKSAPLFSNNERYQFRYELVAEHRQLHDFLLRVRDQGSVEDDIFGGSGEMPPEFRALIEDESRTALLENSPLQDHRKFFTFDVEILRGEERMGLLSKRFGHGSGGEHYTPLYVIFGAALKSAYGTAPGSPSGIMLLDEAFKAMDAQNTRAAAKYLDDLGLQLVLAAPESEQPKLSSFLSMYYDIARYGSGSVELVPSTLGQRARDMLAEDDYLFHPELVQQEIRRLTTGKDE